MILIRPRYASVPSAVAAMREGAFDYVTKPFDNDELRALVARALELIAARAREPLPAPGARQPLRARADDRARARDAAACSTSAAGGADARRRVLIQGESGTGKELVARALHYWSDRAAQPFVAVNCAALAPRRARERALRPRAAARSPARSQARAGCFERADGGTLFLDEIGEMSLDFQAKLLRVLQEGEVRRVGGVEAARTSTCASSPPPTATCATRSRPGRFREDLYFRLNVIPIAAAPLRERREDILPLARHFLARHAERPLALSAEAESAASSQHAWPGNVRELENAIERAVVLARGETIEPEDLLLEPAVSAGGLNRPRRE